MSEGRRRRRRRHLHTLINPSIQYSGLLPTLDCTRIGLQADRPSSRPPPSSLHLTYFQPLLPLRIQSPGASPHLVSPLRIKHHLETAAGPRSSVPHPPHPGQSQPATTITPFALVATTIAGLHSTAPTRHHLGAHALIAFRCCTPLTYPLVYLAHGSLS